MDGSKTKFSVDVYTTHNGTVKVSLDEVNGRQFINLRFWAKTDEGEIPTPKGIYVPAEQYDNIMNAFDEMVKYISPTWRK